MVLREKDRCFVATQLQTQCDDGCAYVIEKYAGELPDIGCDLRSATLRQ